MASIEDAVAGMETILRTDLPAILQQIEAEKHDGIKLDIIRAFEWEEVRESIKQTPTVLIIGNEDSDPTLKDMLYDAELTVIFIVTDRNKTYVTKKLYRYAEALRRVLRPSRNRTLQGAIVSAKVTKVSYSPTFVDRDNLFARDFQATVALRIPRST